ncbi:MAG: hypothetical protein LAT65_08630 [Saccharospirillum sp.]|nr:hypothetical protein [Saccharospirillum sp.]
MYKPVLPTLIASLMLSACNSDSNDSVQTGKDQPNNTHNLCINHRVGSEDFLKASQPIHGPSTITSIDSLNQVVADFGTEVVDTIDRTGVDGLKELMTAQGVVTTILAAQLTGTLSALGLMHACTSEEFAASGCSTRTISPWVVDDPDAVYLRLNTEVNGQRYIRRIEEATSSSGPWEERYRLEGPIGDLGNVDIIMQTEDGEETLVYSRSINGAENIKFSALQRTFTIAEDANCSGRIDYEATSETQSISLNGTWQFNQGRTSAHLDFLNIDLTSGDRLAGEYRW